MPRTRQKGGVFLQSATSMVFSMERFTALLDSKRLLEHALPPGVAIIAFATNSPTIEHALPLSVAISTFAPCSAPRASARCRGGPVCTFGVLQTRNSRRCTSEIKLSQTPVCGGGPVFASRPRQLGQPGPARQCAAYWACQGGAQTLLGKLLHGISLAHRSCAE